MAKLFALVAILTLSSCASPTWVAYNCVNEANEPGWYEIAVSRQDSESMLSILNSQGRLMDGRSYQFWYTNEEEIIRLCRVPKGKGHSYRGNPACTTTSVSHFVRKEDGSFENVADRDIDIVCVG